MTPMEWAAITAVGLFALIVWVRFSLEKSPEPERPCPHQALAKQYRQQMELFRGEWMASQVALRQASKGCARLSRRVSRLRQVIAQQRAELDKLRSVAP